MIEGKRINVGIILSTTLREWHEIQAQIGEKADIVFVKKVACPHKLRISEEFAINMFSFSSVGIFGCLS